MLILVIAFSFIRSLKVLAPFSLIANILTIGGLCVIMQYVVRSHEPLDQFPLITDPSKWPVFFASAMYVFEGIALVGKSKETKNKSKIVDLGSTSSTENERTPSIRRIKWCSKHWNVHCNNYLFFCWIFWLYSIWIRCTWIN